MTASTVLNNAPRGKGAAEPYRDLGLDYFDRLNKEQLERSLVKRLEKLGHRVILEPSAAA